MTGNSPGIQLWGAIYLFVVGLYEIGLGLLMLSTKKYIMDLAPRLRVGLIGIFYGNRKAKKYKQQLIMQRNWKFWGIYSLVGGLFIIAAGIWVVMP